MSVSEALITLCQKSLSFKSYSTLYAFMYFFRFPRNAPLSFERPVRKQCVVHGACTGQSCLILLRGFLEVLDPNNNDRTKTEKVW